MGMHTQYSRGAMIQAGTANLWRRAAFYALSVMVMSWVAGGCSLGRDNGQIQRGHPPEWFRERHERTLRDFYGYQIRTQQRRRQVVQIRVLKTEKWWVGERRRVTARERMDERGQAIERDFFRMWQRSSGHATNFCR